MKRIALAALALCVTACSQSRPEPAPSAGYTGPAAEWVATVASRNEEADRLIDRGDLPAARRLLASIVASQPASGIYPDTGRMLLQDTYFRLARLALAAREPEAAAAHARQGLALGAAQDGPDLFVANLLVARGAAHEALGETREALADYDRALRINEQLLHTTLTPP